MILIKKDQVDQIIFLKMAFIVKEPNLGWTNNIIMVTVKTVAKILKIINFE
jgi:hypothetical protein